MSVLFSTRSARRAFTLIEMLVTVALVTVLMLAVTQIFSIASRTIGGGQALGTAIRDSQAAQSVFSNDLNRIVNDSAALVINMNRRGAFRNRADLVSDPTPANPMSRDLDGNGDETGPSEADNLRGDGYFTYDFRNHRQDMLLFFARGKFSRQTGNDGTLVDSTTANEAMIAYHHVVKANTDGRYFLKGSTTDSSNPGAGTADSNAENFFANQWMLGRSAILLTNDAPTLAAQSHYERPSTATSLEPLYFDSLSTGSGPPRALKSSRYDIAATTIGGFTSILQTYIKNDPPVADPEGSRGEFHDWMTQLLTQDQSRVQASPSFGGAVTAAGVSQQVPLFVPASNQFIVEFAGDFVTQNWNPNIADPPDSPSDIGDPAYQPIYGTVDRTTPLGVIDARANRPDGRIDTVGNTGQIRWYGMPRDTNGNGIISAADGDVVPVRDVAGRRQRFERQLPDSTTRVDENNYATANPNNIARALNFDYATMPVPAALNPKYIVAWPPPEPGDVPTEEWTRNRPKMIRIVMGIDRPEGEGRLSDGQLFEYVFNLGF